MDWLTGGERRELAAERIYDAAAEVIAVRGFDRVNVDDIAAAVGCSRATVYRHVGGKRDIREAVLARAVARVSDSVRKSVAHLAGRDRAVAGTLESLRVVRADPIASALLSSSSTMHWITNSLAASPRLTTGAAELTGLDPNDAAAAEWVVRVVLALLYWPMSDPVAEEAMVRRFLAHGLSESEVS